MTALGFIKGTGPINQRKMKLIAKTSARVEESTREELAKRADDLWAQHEGAMKSRPVS